MKLKHIKRALALACLPLISQPLLANTQATINLDVKHITGGISSFDREKFIVLHSSPEDADWVGDEDKLDYMVNKLDVYFGRDNGSMNWYMNQANEDPSRPGYADPEWVSGYGHYYRTDNYGKEKANLHKYENRGDVMIGGQHHPFWHGESTNPCCGGTPWKIAGPDAMGEFMGRFVNDFYRNPGQGPESGPERPKYLEIINEPLYSMVTVGNFTPYDIFKFHNDVADGIRKVNNTVKIGGYTTAFPFFEERNFQRWHERMKLFIDTSGKKMDFFSIHFYDFNEMWNNRIYGYDGPHNFKGSRMEATMDMVEQYSKLKLGHVKPYIISEYGGRDHKLEAGQWTPSRDWHFMKSFTPMMMQYMDKPDLMLKTIPFILVKAKWAGEVYDWRLLRQAKEAPGQTGNNWVFTEMVKFFELWSDVKGTRVDTLSNNPDVLVDTYVNGNKAYVILSNLNFAPENVSLNVFGNTNAKVKNVKIKHLYLAGNAPRLATSNLTSAPNTFKLQTEASAILEYTFDRNIQISKTSQEKKYYANTYLKPIQANKAISFAINGVSAGNYGEGVLRISTGRNHGLSLRPQVNFNGNLLDTVEIGGDSQNKRANFFGMLEIPVPNEYIRANNNVTVTFPDNGGHVSSVTMEVFKFSANIRDNDAPAPTTTPRPTSVPTPIPGAKQVVVELENFLNTGRTGAPVGGDTAAGFNKTGRFIDTNTSGDWADYRVTLSAGKWQPTITIATPVSGNIGAKLYLNGREVASKTFPSTGDWMVFKDFTFNQTISIASAGTFTLRVQSFGNTAWQWNGDKITLNRVSGDPSVPLPTSVPTTAPTTPPGSGTDQCNTTNQCKVLFGSQATDCRNSQSDQSICMCGNSPCSGANNPAPVPTPVPIPTALPSAAPTPDRDQCDLTSQCKAIFGAQATDCKNSSSNASVCMCGSSPC